MWESIKNLEVIGEKVGDFPWKHRTYKDNDTGEETTVEILSEYYTKYRQIIEMYRSGDNYKRRWCEYNLQTGDLIEESRYFWEDQEYQLECTVYDDKGLYQLDENGWPKKELKPIVAADEFKYAKYGYNDGKVEFEYLGRGKGRSNTKVFDNDGNIVYEDDRRVEGNSIVYNVYNTIICCDGESIEKSSGGTTIRDKNGKVMSISIEDIHDENDNDRGTSVTLRTSKDGEDIIFCANNEFAFGSSDFRKVYDSLSYCGWAMNNDCIPVKLSNKDMLVKAFNKEKECVMSTIENMEKQLPGILEKYKDAMSRMSGDESNKWKEEIQRLEKYMQARGIASIDKNNKINDLMDELENVKKESANIKDYNNIEKAQAKNEGDVDNSEM